MTRKTKKLIQDFDDACHAHAELGITQQLKPLKPEDQETIKKYYLTTKQKLMLHILVLEAQIKMKSL